MKMEIADMFWGGGAEAVWLCLDAFLHNGGGWENE